MSELQSLGEFVEHNARIAREARLHEIWSDLDGAIDQALGALAEMKVPVEDVAIGVDTALAESDGWASFRSDEPKCICPPDLVARGGYKGGCPVHG